MLERSRTERVYRVAHLACGIGSGAAGFNDARATVDGVAGRYECAGGIDVDAGAIANFDRMTGARGTVMDLFNREQYAAFHGHQPPVGWKEASPADVRRAFGGSRPLDVLFASMPCKGFSSLLGSEYAVTDKYQALNALTTRGMWLTLEAYRDDPIKILLFENVPLIQTKGRKLLDEIQALLLHYGYVWTESKHDCGEIGGLAQHRRRFLMVARHVDSMPPFLYEPHRLPVRPIGDVLGALPLPGDPRGGPMHRIPELQWKTWSRLAFVKAGRDWRSLRDPDMAVVDGRLANWGIRPLDGAPVGVGSQLPPGSPHHEVLGVRPWGEASGTVAGASRPHNGTYSVADPRYDGRDRSSTLGVHRWDETSGTVTGETHPSNGKFAVADGRRAGAVPQRVEHFRIVPATPEAPLGDGTSVLPAEGRRLAARIISADGTWHRPLTVLELAALQSLFDPEEVFGEGRDGSFNLVGGSEGRSREWIGNAVPRRAARGMGETILECLLMGDLEVAFALSSRAIWVRPLALELAVDPRAPGGALHVERTLGG
jgi:site-specific DNA-cytosine methylase